MRRMKMLFSYDGSNFFGYQKQPNKRSVQATIEHVLRNLDVQPVHIVASGRTDAKVHACAQVAHFDMSRANISAENLQYIFFRQLPPDIQVHCVEEITREFHARFDVKMKEYWYKFRTPEQTARSPFNARYYTYIRHTPSLETLNRICLKYIGEHDFTAFSCMMANYDCRRTIYECSCNYDAKEDCYIFKIKGNGFLQYMVRMLVGFMLAIEHGKEDIEKIDQLYASKDRRYVNTKMPPEGLYLMKVTY